MQENAIRDLIIKYWKKLKKFRRKTQSENFEGYSYSTLEFRTQFSSLYPNKNKQEKKLCFGKTKIIYCSKIEIPEKFHQKMISLAPRYLIPYFLRILSLVEAKGCLVHVPHKRIIKILQKSEMKRLGKNETTIPSWNPNLEKTNYKRESNQRIWSLIN